VKLGPGRLRLPDPEKYLSRTTGKVRLRVALQPILPPGVGVGPRRPVIEDFDLEIEGTRE
jgi:hypothetical protein